MPGIFSYVPLPTPPLATGTTGGLGAAPDYPASLPAARLRPPLVTGRRGWPGGKPEDQQPGGIFS